MFEDLIYSLRNVWDGFDWFGLAGSQTVLSTADLIVLLLGNNVFMVLLTLFLGSRWGAEKQRSKDLYARSKEERARVEISMDRNVF